MRLMKRILSAAAVLALSASLLVGCSSGTASSVPVSASSAAESTVSSVEETASSAVDENEAAPNYHFYTRNRQIKSTFSVIIK